MGLPMRSSPRCIVTSHILGGSHSEGQQHMPRNGPHTPRAPRAADTSTPDDRRL